MKHLHAILAALLLAAAPAQAQTLKSLVYNTTNGQVVAATNVTFTNAIGFTTNAAAATRTNLGLGATNTLVLFGLWASNNLEVTKIIFNDQPTNQTRIQFEAPSQAKTVVRNLTGSTNTNEPYSGTFEFKNATDNVFVATVSNGIILSVQQQ